MAKISDMCLQRAPGRPNLTTEPLPEIGELWVARRGW